MSWTPATTALILRATTTFDGGPFIDERRLRERLQSLAGARVVRSFSTANVGGGLRNYYKLTRLGFELRWGSDAERPTRVFFGEVLPSVHTFRLAEVIVQSLLACHARRVTIEHFIRENELMFEASDQQVQPDCFFRLATQGRVFNLAFEIDNSTASVDSHALNSIRKKLTVYHAYQDLVLSKWLAGGKKWERPRFRVVFLTPSVERAYHILSLAHETTGDRTRRLVYAATFDEFVTVAEPFHAPVFLDLRGDWRSLIDLHPTAPYQKAPVRLSRPRAYALGV